MITLERHGTHKLIETKNDTKVLYLDEDVYAWVEPPIFGEILVSSHREHQPDCVLSLGEYYLYNVKDEPQVTDLLHLELEVGRGAWQGYLLPTGLPNGIKKRARIIPTRETITGEPKFAGKAAKP